MFIQVIQGRAKDPVALRKHMDRWLEELAPGAEGWLGATAGVTNDGEFVAVVRFESEDLARRNSEGPDQTEWWNELSRELDGEATVLDSPNAELWMAGGSDDAGFVQIIQGHMKDPDTVRNLLAEEELSTNDARPDVIGGTIARHDGDRFTQTVYFTSEKEARDAEANPSPEYEASSQRWMAAIDDVRFIDLKDPWLSSA